LEDVEFLPSKCEATAEEREGRKEERRGRENNNDRKETLSSSI
jgi:hypothetical protein